MLSVSWLVLQNTTFDDDVQFPHGFEWPSENPISRGVEVIALENLTQANVITSTCTNIPAGQCSASFRSLCGIWKFTLPGPLGKPRLCVHRYPLPWVLPDRRLYVI